MTRRSVQANPTDSKLLDVAVVCPVCRQTNTVTVSNKGYGEWIDGEQLIQEAMPELSAVQREILISGIDGHCWNVVFAPGGSDD